MASFCPVTPQSLFSTSHFPHRTFQPHSLLPLHSPHLFRKSVSSLWGTDSPTFKIHSSLTDFTVDVAVEEKKLPKGETWSVHKFGGTCVGSSARINNVADVIINDDSERKLVVVSAMSKVTDMMYDLIYKAQSQDKSYISALDVVEEKHSLTAHELFDEDDLATFLANLHQDIRNLKAMLHAIDIAGHATESFTDLVVGHGELWSAQILCYAVKKKGTECKWMDTREVLIVNSTSADHVDPDYLESERRLNKWYSLNPSKVTIWTDVDGVYSADPRKVSDAVILKTLSYREASEMSYFGANVLHPRTISPVIRYGIPVIIRNIFNTSAPGTKVCHPSLIENEDKKILKNYVKGFTTIDNLALVNVEGTGMAGVPGTASTIFRAVKEVGANVIMISQASSEQSVCFAVPEKEVKAVSEALQSMFQNALYAGRLSQVAVIPNCSILAAVGQKMASTPGVSATLFNALAKANINILAIAQGCSEYNVSVVLKRKDSIKALRAVHSRFYNSETTIAMGIIGPGLVGSTLLDQLRDQAETLKEESNIDLRVMGIMGSKSMLLDDSGIDLVKWSEIREEKADSGVASHYNDWLRKGIHVVTPNKKANSGPLDEYLRLRVLQRQSYTHYFYEATVGAGLPIISTLRGLLETGDKILQIEGIFSGTLSYILNNFKDGRVFSDVVAEAKEAGYTEPDPRDDLSGTDVARKVIILARESGLKLELSDIPVENLVPEQLRASASAQEFMQKLPKFDHEISKKQEDADTAGEVLRYVGVVDVANQKGSVELRRYKKDHPFAQLSGSDNIIAFTTRRYRDQPLIVRGPGAGAQVTAGGIFSDILRLASYLGAPS
ncbi:unnamed protein product [Vicia faba]|uniref:ACT domain-containing protein n=1 Tax=Vicia faba TaxID=3906 RepID=A0AAV0ZJT0_VICFA|nr:unnamed protein product [Vicia faba]